MAFGKIDKTAQEYAGDLDIISGAERKTEIAKGTQHAATVRSSARLEETKEELDNKRIIELAEARASQVRGVEPVRAAAILAEAWKTVAKKSLDRFANLSWEQKVAAAGEANKGVRTATNPAEKSAALTRSIGALTSVFNEGSETGKAGYLNALSSAGFFEHETEINDDNRLQATASAILGRYVDSAGLEAALAEINGGFGNDEEDAPPPPHADAMEDCPLFILEAHVDEVTALHLKGDTLVSGSADKTLRQWDLVKGRCVQTLDVLWAAAQATATMSTLDAQWRPTGRSADANADFVGAIQCFDAALACGTADGMVRLWDLRSGHVHRSLVGHTGPVTCLQFDDTHLVTGSADRSVRVCSTVHA